MSNCEASDNELVELSQKGDRDAFGVLIQRYQKQTLTIAFRILGNIEDAEDACQNAWIAIWKSINTYKQDKASFRVWIFCIVSNNCKDEYRKRKRRATSTIDGIPLEKIPSYSTMENSQAMIVSIQNALLQVSYDLRMVVILFDYLGLSYQEVATIIKRPAGTVKSRLSRGRLKLANILKKDNMV